MTAPSALPRALKPFRHQQYRLLCMGLVLAMFADGIWTVGVVWQVIGMGGGPGQLSLVTAVAAVGMVASTLLGGVLADRMSQRTILIALEATKLVAIGGVGLLALTDSVILWHLVAVSLIGGVTTGIYYPTYSALLPTLVPRDELMAANGIEGTLRPTIFQAAGPVVAGGLIAMSSPAVAIIGSAVASALSGILYLLMRPTPSRSESRPKAELVRGTINDIAEGFVYMWRTPWLLATLLFAMVLVLLVMGPLEVLIPFALKDRAGGDAGSHAMVLAAFGIGGAAGSLVLASMQMPRRYLTVMFVIWGLSSLPLVVMGLTDQVWVFVVAGFVLGFAFDGPMVIWGTLLQRRVPIHMLGRVSSLDFFVSVALMPVSMAIAAPVSQWIGLTATFVIAGIVPVPVAAVAYFWAKLSADEIAHPLRDDPIVEVIATPSVVLEKKLTGGSLDQIGQVVDDR
ncbi:MFS transporter [Williamsia sp. 1138]|uniref:MFS transporter n=1 Tax=Williamsia sp. 1138 TaxID=1903117 RepID=UPI000B9BD048|nr:MFS transporter [Williamsia sp. 1138]OZG25879.1 MFS transporter [Williamsia sp. 1138]